MNFHRRNERTSPLILCSFKKNVFIYIYVSSFKTLWMFKRLHLDINSCRETELTSCSACFALSPSVLNFCSLSLLPSLLLLVSTLGPIARQMESRWGLSLVWGPSQVFQNLLSRIYRYDQLPTDISGGLWQSLRGSRVWLVSLNMIAKALRQYSKAN